MKGIIKLKLRSLLSIFSIENKLFIFQVLVKNGACLGAENKDGVTIFNYKLATNQLLHKLLDQLPQESPWATSELCQECGTKFTITMRKHHWYDKIKQFFQKIPKINLFHLFFLFSCFRIVVIVVVFYAANVQTTIFQF